MKNHPIEPLRALGFNFLFSRFDRLFVKGAPFVLQKRTRKKAFGLWLKLLFVGREKMQNSRHSFGGSSHAINFLHGMLEVFLGLTKNEKPFMLHLLSKHLPQRMNRGVVGQQRLCPYSFNIRHGVMQQ